MKILKIVIAIYLASSLGAVNATEVLGLKICGTTSINQVKSVIKSNGASISEEKTDDESGEIILNTKDFNLVSEINEVSFRLYKGKLYKIVIKDGGNISSILEAKYGVLTHKQSNIGNDAKIVFFYNSKDRNVNITYTNNFQISATNTAENSFPVEYLCVPIYNQLLAQLEKIEIIISCKKKE